LQVSVNQIIVFIFDHFVFRKTLKEVWEKQMKDREAYNTTDQIFQ